MTGNALTENPLPGTAVPASGRDRPPRDYRFTVPRGWERIVLDPATWDRRIAAIVEQRFQDVCDTPRQRTRLRDDLRAQAERGRAGGGLELYLSLARLGNVPLPGGLLVSVIPPPETVPPTLDDLAGALAATGADVRITAIPAGPALVTRAWEQPDPEGRMGSMGPVFHMSVQVPVPHTYAYLLLSFSTPVPPPAEEQAEVFEAIASTLRWVA